MRCGSGSPRRSASGRLGVLAAIDARDDVIPKARVGEAGAVFASHALRAAPRAAPAGTPRWAGCCAREVGDLPAVGAAYAAGDISPAHVEVVVRTHRDLGAAVREALIDCQLPDDDRRSTTPTATDDGDGDGGGGSCGRRWRGSVTRSPPGSARSGWWT